MQTFPSPHVHAPVGVGNPVDQQPAHPWALDQSQLNPAAALFFCTGYPYSRHPQTLRAALSRLDCRQFQPFDACLMDGDITGTVEAITCYHSQTSPFWESVAAVRQQTVQDMRSLGGGRPVVEHAWLVRPIEEGY